MSERKCMECEVPIEGRSDKVFCSHYCKSSFHYQKNREKNMTLFARIDRQLKLNRRLLLHFNSVGRSTIRAEKLQAAGFDPRYFTHYWKNQEDKIYLFCYDVGFLTLHQNGRKKYLLIDWQDYMTPSNRTGQRTH